jgi:hypothetical protein
MVTGQFLIPENQEKKDHLRMKLLEMLNGKK